MSQRKELLEALANLISPKHPALAVVEAQLAALVTIEQLQDRLQTVLPLKFKSKAGQ